MKFVLATAAALVVAGSASAADMARKAPAAVDYVKVCDTYGAGFFYIPGSETCLKIGGYVRAEAYTSGGDFGDYGSARTQNSFGTHSRLNLNVDVRSNTEWGVLKAYGSINADAKSGTWDSSKSAMGGASNAVALDAAYIQWGGLTAGYTTSKFDFFTGYETHFFYGEFAHDDTVNLLAYTFGLGNGVSATLSLEDPTFAGRGALSGPNTFVYGGLKVPDVVANVNITQAWGSAQVMGVLHNVYTTNTDGTPGFSQWGYAVGAGVTVNLPSLGAGDALGLQAVYGHGALRYVQGQHSYYSYGDNVQTSGVNELASAWSVQAGYKHSFSSTLAGNIDVAYLNYDGPTLLTDKYQALRSWTVGANLVWTPATNLSVTAAVEYVDRNYGATNFVAPYRMTDGSGWGAGLRIQRSF